MQTLTRNTLQTEPLQVDPTEVAARTNGHIAVRPTAAPSIEDDITTALNLQDFRTWLVRLGNREAGKANETNACPIARYLNSTTGHVVAVHPRAVISYEDGAEGKRVRGPDWVRYFVFCVDQGPGSEPISAVKCLELLDAFRA